MEYKPAMRRAMRDCAERGLYEASKWLLSLIIIARWPNLTVVLLFNTSAQGSRISAGLPVGSPCERQSLCRRNAAELARYNTL